MRFGYRPRLTGGSAQWLQLAGAAGLLSACGAVAAVTATPAPVATAAPPARVAAATTSLGAVLTDAAGFTLYYFLPEQGAKLVCTGSCAATWPLLTTGGSPVAGGGVTGQLGTMPGPGNTVVVTYAGWPLHRYSGDTAPGQTNGQGMSGKWFAAIVALTPTGPPTPPPTATPTPPAAAATAAPRTARPATAPPATAAPATAPPTMVPPPTYTPY